MAIDAINRQMAHYPYHVGTDRLHRQMIRGGPGKVFPYPGELRSTSTVGMEDKHGPATNHGPAAK